MTAPARCERGHCARMGRDGPGLCRSCAARSGQWLAELPPLVHLLADPPSAEPDGAHSVVHDWAKCRRCLHHIVCGHVPRCKGHAAVLVAAGPTRGTDGEPVSGSRVPPIPVNVDVLSLLGPSAVDYTTLDPGDQRTGPMQDGREPLSVTLVRLCGWVAEERSLAYPRRTAVSLLRFLSIHHDWTVRQPWSDDYAVDLYRLWLDCKRLTGMFDGRPEPMVGVPCPRCDRMALVRRPGEEGRFCDRADGGCGQWLSEKDYATWTRLEAHWASQRTSA